MGESGAAELHPIEHLERILEEIGLGESTRARALLLAIRSLAHSALEPPAQQVCEQQFRLSLAHGATYLWILLVLAMGLSVLTFARRDVP